MPIQLAFEWAATLHPLPAMIQLAFEWAATLHPLPAILLILIGLLLLFLEFFVISFGLLTLSGLLCVIAGIALLLESGVFSSPIEAQVAMAHAVEWVLAAVVLLTALVIGSLVLRSQLRNRRLYGHAEQRFGPDTGVNPNTVRLANSLTPIRNDKPGKIFYKGTYWSARLHGETEVQANQNVQIIDWDGMTAIVCSDKPPDKTRIPLGTPGESSEPEKEP